MKSIQFKAFLLLWLALCTGITVFAQNIIKGRVTSEDDHKALAGVSVVVKATKAGTQTNEQGEFTISAPVGSLITFSSTGYAPKDVKVTDDDFLEVSLKATTAKLDEVIVVGYGTQKRKEFAGSASTLNTMQTKHTPSLNVATALQGAVPGLVVQQATGQPGSTPAIVLRGGTGWGGGVPPLFILDGVVVTSLYGIDMNDVESIDVLKDAASTAIYGARGANGVVLVTTKKGKKGRAQVQYSVKQTYNRIRSIADEYLSAADYIRMNRLGLRARYLADSLTGGAYASDKGQLTANWGWAFGTTFGSPTGLYTTQKVGASNRQLIGTSGWNLLIDPNPFYPNAMDSILYRELSTKEREAMIMGNSSTTEHHIDFSGANDMGGFALGLTTAIDNGIIYGSKLRRITANFNGSLNINKYLKVNLNTSAYNVNPDYPYSEPGVANSTGATGGLLQRFIGVAPTVRYNNDTSGAILPGPNDVTLGNPMYWSTLYVNSQNEQRFSGGIGLEYTILPSLKFLINANGFMRFSNSNSFTKSYQQGSGGAFNTSRPASFGYSRYQMYTVNAFLQYSKSFKGHSIMVLGGPEYNEDKSYGYSGSAQGAPTDQIPWLSASLPPTVINGVIVNPVGASSGFNGWSRLVSLIGRTVYSYKDRYFVNAIIRYDGSSRLDRSNYYGTFPGAGLGWNMHNEDFFRKLSVSKYVSTFKPRLSYGVNGNLSSLSGYYPTAQVLSNAGVYNGLGGTYTANFLNPYMRWERVRSVNYGFDLGLIRNRVNITFDYFVRNVFDKIASQPISISTGFGSYQSNIGQLRNKGLELSFTAKPIVPTKAKGISIEVGGSFSTVKNYAVKLANNGQPNNRIDGFEVWDPNNPGSKMYVGGLQEGMRVGYDEVWAPMWDGIYTTQAQLDADANVYMGYLPYTNKKFKQLGDAKWHQVYKNDTINQFQFVYVGRTTPKATGNFYLNTSYKGLRLYTAFDYAYGFVILNNEKLRGLSQVQGSQNGTKDILNTWSPSNPSGTLPMFYWANQGRNYATDASGNNPPANMWEKGDYVMLREVSLSYDIPQPILATVLKNRIKGISLSITGSNLKYFTKYSGTFPEFGGFDNGRYPLPKRLTLGAQVTF